MDPALDAASGAALDAALDAALEGALGGAATLAAGLAGADLAGAADEAGADLAAADLAGGDVVAPAGLAANRAGADLSGDADPTGGDWTDGDALRDLTPVLDFSGAAAGVRADALGAAFAGSLEAAFVGANRDVGPPFFAAFAGALALAAGAGTERGELAPRFAAGSSRVLLMAPVDFVEAGAAALTAASPRSLPDLAGADLPVADAACLNLALDVGSAAAGPVALSSGASCLGTSDLDESTRVAERAAPASLDSKPGRGCPASAAEEAVLREDLDDAFPAMLTTSTLGRQDRGCSLGVG